ncbi:mechanosensitive ion channel family protein [Haloimpatiens sp. FM7315]|uniref:mechanosensitive ion channel family protein n=1 Tax=Haloimpatiens sp. FM7315 TaxID=3298609 RepID=UPI00370BB167
MEVIEVFLKRTEEFSKYLSFHTLKIFAVALVIFFCFMIFRKIFSKYLLGFLLKLFNRKNAETRAKLSLAFEKPVSMFFLFIGIYISVYYIRLNLLGDNYVTSVFLNKIFSSVVIINIAWGLCNLTNGSSVLFDKMQQKFDINLDKILFPFVSKIIRFLIIAFAVIMVIEKWGYDIQGFIAGLGLGGLAFALAAKDAASNIFGGMIILMDKPFNIGDWIYTPSVEGIVEDISFRSTRVRTFDEGLVTVPNSKLVNEAITNWSRREKRRVSFSIGVNYNTPIEKIKICVKEIGDMIKASEGVDEKNIIVNFDEFSKSSLDICIYFYVNTSILSKYLEIKEAINLNIMQILEKNKVSMAFPTTSVYIESTKETEGKQEGEGIWKNNQ